MTKKEIQTLLMSMRTSDNAKVVNNVLGKIDMMSEIEISTLVSKQLGDDPNKVSEFLRQKIAQHTQPRQNDQKHPINDLYEYGISGKSIHLHLPVNLQEVSKGYGHSGMVDTANLYLLDAIDRIAKQKDSGSVELKDVEQIYMISPILIRKELEFLKGFGFSTEFYKIGSLQDQKFVESHPEAQLALSIFGSSKNVGACSIPIDKVKSKEWQEMKKAKMEEYAKKGITIRPLDKDNKDEER